MKKLIISLCTVAVVAVAAFNLSVADMAEPTNNLRLGNVEALAAGENDYSEVYCLYSGSVDCPDNGVRVYYVFAM